MKIINSSNYNRDYKKLQSLSPNKKKKLLKNLETVSAVLSAKKQLDPIYKDHRLAGFPKNRNIRECHILPDVCLVYEEKDEIIIFLRIGNHANLSLTDSLENK